MQQAWRGARMLVVVAVSLLLAACRVPVSEHPLTSEMPSVDERLIGTWEVEMSAFADGDEDKRLAIYHVRRLKDDATRLEIVGVQDGVEQVADATKLITCHHAMHDYLSIGPMNKDAGTAYMICTYRFDDADRGNVYLLDSEYMIDAIDRGLIAGEISRDGARVTSIALRAPPAELRRFMEKHAPACFATKTPLAARRIK